VGSGVERRWGSGAALEALETATAPALKPSNPPIRSSHRRLMAGFRLSLTMVSFAD
jgi:hypothetical protein